MSEQKTNENTIISLILLLT